MRKKKDEEHENLERWLLTYADLITLLLAFFIMLYTFSKQDAQKYSEVTGHLKAIFSGTSGIHNGGEKGKIVEPLSRGASPEEIKRYIEEKLKTIARLENLQNNISVFSDERGIVIRILDSTFFDEGRADLKEKARQTLDRLIPVLQSVSNHIRIEGHTDNVPIYNYEFKSNWELSVRRATEVVRYLIERGGIPPIRVSAAGYAEYRPVTTNDTPEGRALNRRIEIIVVKGPSKTDPFGVKARLEP
jgi:chemotaxis protein MotB